MFVSPSPLNKYNHAPKKQIQQAKHDDLHYYDVSWYGLHKKTKS